MTVAASLPIQPTTLFYYLEPKDGGIIQTYPGTAFEKRRKHVPFDVNINDLRSKRDEFTIDSAKFQLVNFKSKVKDFANEDEIKKLWNDEVVNKIKDVWCGVIDKHVISYHEEGYKGGLGDPEHNTRHSLAM